MTTIDPLAAARVRARACVCVKGGVKHLSRAVVERSKTH